MKGKRRFGLWNVVLLSLASALTASTMWAHAQQRIVTGKSSLPDASELRVARVQFEPGARTFWHSHARGQVIFVEKGRGRLQERGKPIKELGPGDTVYVTPGVMHWHGAAPDQSMLHVSLLFGGETTMSEEEVTDAQYLGKSRK